MFTEADLKGYWTGSTYKGYNPESDRYEEFVSDTEYFEIMRERINSGG